MRPKAQNRKKWMAYSIDTTATPGSSVSAKTKMTPASMADDLPHKIAKVKKRRDATKGKTSEKPVPAGASGGVLGNASLEKVTTTLRRIFRSKGGSPSGNARDEMTSQPGIYK